ncbi:MAG: sterol carrier family protein [Nocardioidaceae bacterium]
MRLTRLTPLELSTALDRVAAGEAARAELGGLTKHLLALLVDKAPGGGVEVRIPPYAVAQCVTGSRHTRGTPPAVVEMDAATWIALGSGRLSWRDAVAAGRVSASGERSDLSALLPLLPC